MLMGVAQVIFYNQDMDTHRTELHRIEQMKKEMEWTLFLSTFNSLQAAANEKADHNAVSLINELRIAYPDMNILKMQLDDGVIGESKLPFLCYSILNENPLFGIKNKYNDGFILSRSKFVLDTNIDQYGKAWHKFHEDKSLDIELFYDILEDQIDHRENKIIYTVPSGSPYIPRLIIADKRIEDLKDTFDEYGFEGFRDHIFYGKAYITETGDVFGTPDISESTMKKNMNHKLIVVQKFNMYDVINLHHSKDLEINRIHFAHMKHALEQNTIIRNIGYLILMILDIIAMLVIIFCTAIGRKNEPQN
jgi:hypothetical protein